MGINSTAKDTETLQNFLKIKSQRNMWEVLFKDLRPLCNFIRPVEITVSLGSHLQ